MGPLARRGLRTRIGLRVGCELGLPTRLPAGVRGAADEAMRDDKKVAGGRIRLMSPTPDRRVVIVDDPSAGALRGALERLGAAA